MTYLTVQKSVQYSLWEDLKDIGDITTNILIPQDSVGQAQIVSKESGVLFGIEYVVETFRQLDKTVCLTVKKHDGNFVEKDTVIATLSGSTRAILTGERTALNFLGHLSGIASVTQKAVAIAKPYGVSIACTRKTTPMLRESEKMAVKMGGGDTHRFGLYDHILIKDNHLVACSDIVTATRMVQKVAKKGTIIEVEVDTLEQLKTVLPAKPHRILLDNMSPAMVKKACSIANGAVSLEVSGNITFKTLRAYCQTGVNILSMGLLTHSANNLDVSMEFLRA